MAELHRSFASLSQEDQKLAEIFLHDIQRGDVSTDPELTFQDYLVDYRVRAKRDEIAAVIAITGVDAEKLAALMDANLSEINLNEYGRFDDLRFTADMQRAKTYFDSIEGISLPMFKVKIKVAKLLIDFLVSGVSPKPADHSK